MKGNWGGVFGWDAVGLRGTCPRFLTGRHVGQWKAPTCRSSPYAHHMRAELWELVPFFSDMTGVGFSGMFSPVEGRDPRFHEGIHDKF
jgi:hypothetical protein